MWRVLTLGSGLFRILSPTVDIETEIKKQTIINSDPYNKDNISVFFKILLLTHSQTSSPYGHLSLSRTVLLVPKIHVKQCLYNTDTSIWWKRQYFLIGSLCNHDGTKAMRTSSKNNSFIMQISNAPALHFLASVWVFPVKSKLQQSILQMQRWP